MASARFPEHTLIASELIELQGSQIIQRIDGNGNRPGPSLFMDVVADHGLKQKD